MPRREAVAKTATPNPRPANWLLAVPVFGSFLPFERPGPAGCCAGACEWFNALEIEALSDKLAEVLTLSLKLVLVETDSLVLIEADWLAESLLVLVEPEPLPELLLALIEAEMLSLKLALVETDSLALIDAEVLSLNDTLTDLLSETDSLALTDSR